MLKGLAQWTHLINEGGPIAHFKAHECSHQENHPAEASSRQELPQQDDMVNNYHDINGESNISLENIPRDNTKCITWKILQQENQALKSLLQEWLRERDTLLMHLRSSSINQTMGFQQMSILR